MHSLDAPGGTTFHFNGDLSGSVRVVVPARVPISDGREVDVPVADLLALLRCWRVDYPADLQREEMASEGESFYDPRRER